MTLKEKFAQTPYAGKLKFVDDLIIDNGRVLLESVEIERIGEVNEGTVDSVMTYLLAGIMVKLYDDYKGFELSIDNQNVARLIGIK